MLLKNEWSLADLQHEGISAAHHCFLQLFSRMDVTLWWSLSWFPWLQLLSLFIVYCSVNTEHETQLPWGGLCSCENIWVKLLSRTWCTAGCIRGELIQVVSDGNDCEKWKHWQRVFSVPPVHISLLSTFPQSSPVQSPTGFTSAKTTWYVRVK